MKKLTDFDKNDVAGFDISAWKTGDGKYRLQKTIINEFPEELEFNGARYILEEIREGSTNKAGEIYINAIYV